MIQRKWPLVGVLGLFSLEPPSLLEAPAIDPGQGAAPGVGHGFHGPPEREKRMSILRRIAARRALMREMIRRTGADLAKLNRYIGETRSAGLACMGRRPVATTTGRGSSKQVLRNAVIKCVACPSEEECRGWLANAPPGSAPPTFCRNAALLAALKDPS